MPNNWRFTQRYYGCNKAGVDSVLVNWGFSNHEKDAIETV